jgi:hypothetical protein
MAIRIILPPNIRLIRYSVRKMLSVYTAFALLLTTTSVFGQMVAPDELKPQMQLHAGTFYRLIWTHDDGS